MPTARVIVLVAFSLPVAVPGCGGSARPPDASPIVDPKSDAALRAIDESQKLIELRRSQEAGSRRKPKVDPEAG